MFTADRPLLLVGAGNMGRAMAQGWRSGHPPLVAPDALHLLDPALDANAPPLGLDARQIHAGAPVDLSPAAIVLAVKPQIIADILPGLRYSLAGAPLVISIAAGVPLANLSAGLNDYARIIRAMPNTPAAIGKGASVFTAGPAVTADDKAMAHALLLAIGSAHWVDSETLVDAATAVSGSGPAYVFHLIECLETAARDIGLPADVAAALARETVTGAGALAGDSDRSPSSLREAVTSPNGTTAAGLSVLMGEAALESLIRRTVRAAFDRAQALGREAAKP